MMIEIKNLKKSFGARFKSGGTVDATRHCGNSNVVAAVRL